MENLLLKSSATVAILGIAFLLGVMVFPNYIEVNSANIENMEINEKVVISGVVDNEREFGDFKILKINGVDIICDCEDQLINEEIIVKGVVSEYQSQKQIMALTIEFEV